MLGHNPIASRPIASVLDRAYTGGTVTKLYFRNTQANGITSGGVACYDLLTTQGSTVDTAVVTATASGTDIQWTKTAGGSILVFATGRVPSGGWTITQADIAAWFKESVATVNAGARVRFYKWSGGTETLIVGSPFDDGVEFTTTDAEYTWLADVTDTALAEDDRLIVKLYLTNVGTMGAGDATFSFNTDTGSGGAVTYLGAGTRLEALGTSASSLSGSQSIDAASDYVCTPVVLANFAALPSINSVTLGGVSMTAVGAAINGTIDGFPCRIQYYELVAPPTGSQTLAVNLSAACYSIGAISHQFSDVNQTTPSEGLNTGTGAGSTAKNLAPTTTTVSGDYLAGCIIATESTAGVTCNDTQVAEWDFASVGANTTPNCGIAASSGSGNEMNWTTASTSDYIGQVFAIKASTLPATNSYINVYPAVSFKPESGGSYTLTCNAGAYTYTGQSATILKTKLVTASAGSYTYTGQSVGLLKSKLITASAGAYTYTGQSSVLTKSKLIVASAGSYTYSGQSAGLLKSKLITANNGTYTINGQDAVLTWTGAATNYTLTCNAGSYSITGQSAGLLKSKLIVANNGAYTYTGISAGLSRSKLITAQSGSYVYTGQDAVLTKTTAGVYTLTCQSGSYSLTGQSVTITYTSNVVGGGGKLWIPNFSTRTRKPVEVIEEVAQLNLAKPDAEIALRIRLKDDYSDDYLELQALLKDSEEKSLVALKNDIKQELNQEYLMMIEAVLEQQALIIQQENNRRLAIIMMLA
jgi:hypothetical protein